jgi:tetratricopeptide (TPR) repeat protein
MQKLGKWKELIVVADKIIKYDPTNIKAFFRKALSLKHLQEFEEGIALLEKIFKDLDTNEDFKKKVDNDMLNELKKLYQEIKGAYAAYLQKQKSMYQSMFSGK